MELDHDDGFTLIELMVVFSVLAILVLIAVPMFLGARKPAQDKQAEAILHTSLADVKIGATDTGDYSWVSWSAMQALESSVNYVDAATPAAANSRQVSVGTGLMNGNIYVIMVSKSAAGRCFALFEQLAGATGYRADVVPSCEADAYQPLSGWSPGGWPG
ncbi:MAG TPA: prepilin-type N-terminal cleavage/methylation domain-containing protein [Acidimicrobiia bacterium]|jgi:prepilin-type N-terminal cleavage/methylation domain-containing protein